MDNKLVMLVVVFLIVFSAFSVSMYFSSGGTTPSSIRATQKNIPSKDSLCLTSKTEASLGELVPVTCAARDTNEIPVAGAQCCFTTTVGNFNTQCEQTNESGIATVNLTSNTTGTATVTCSINNSINLDPFTVLFSN